MPDTINTIRRYYLLKRRATLDRDESITNAWHFKQDGEPGTVLPPTFPFLDLLGTFYTTVEDLNGADVAELRSFGLAERQACAVLAAVAPLI